MMKCSSVLNLIRQEEQKKSQDFYLELKKKNLQPLKSFKMAKMRLKGLLHQSKCEI